MGSLQAPQLSGTQLNLSDFISTETKEILREMIIWLPFFPPRNGAVISASIRRESRLWIERKSDVAAHTRQDPKSIQQSW